MHAGYSHSLVGAPALFSHSTTEEGQVNISRAINPRFRGVSAEDAPGHRSQLSQRQRKDLMERGGGGGHNVVAKRNARERTRVHTVNKAFHILKQRLPALRIHSKRVSKLRILKAAIVYINNLMDTVGSVRESSRHTALDQALPYIKSFIDYAPYMPQSGVIGSATNSILGGTVGTVSSSSATAPSLEFASILSTAAASIGYSNPWSTTYT
ncbi:hlh-4 [Pristionchus pacificus]|uniref:Hlh-4 n=1 Tax=Pristionchus pacificus TaxID=54126 RepID=A0A2A6BBC7_PRIPA|nr:hlh-4 [Pristionchus pacificus]|eukprot:PDM63164.1 hlh-4 [Pristionchus pacificus]